MEKMKVAEEMANLNLSSEHEDLEKAARKRIEGNELYKAGKLERAIKAYKEAASAAPQDPLPLSNLSAAYFESGQYLLCAQVSQQAIDKAGDKKNAMINKLFPRLMKSLMNLFDWESARISWDDYKEFLEPAVSSAFNEKVLEQAEKSWKLFDDEKIVKKKVLGTLPRYRQSIYQPQIEYHYFGQDEAEPLFDSKLASLGDPTTSLCFAGIGDGRHLFATLIRIAKHEKAATRHSKYHITINDINRHSIARLVIYFQILNYMAKAEAQGRHQERDTLLATFYYLFASVAMPSAISDQVHTTICKVVDLLENGETVKGIDIRSCHKSILKALYSWRDVAPTYYPVSKFLEHHTESQITSELKGVEEEWKLFRTTGAILTSNSLKNEKKLRDLVKKMQISPSAANKTALKSYLAENWKPNVTIMDLDWIKDEISNLAAMWNPFSLGLSFYNDGCKDEAKIAMKKPKVISKHLYDHVTPFFEAVYRAWQQLNGSESVKVEGIVGDFLAVSENIQHEMDDRPSGYPKQFDRIHMSNIPDYTDGPLGVSLYATKILSSRPGHYVIGNNMLNFQAFTSFNEYHNQYLAISDDDSLTKLMQVSFASFYLPVNPYFPVMENLIWKRSSFDPLPFSSLCTRPALTKWLYALFFQLSIPVDQTDTPSIKRIRQSFNITAYFRVLSHLQSIGYPGHWLSEILGKFLDNDVVTSARPPLTSPLDVKEGKNNPMKKISMAPYILEMRTLSTLFQRILPFAISTMISNPARIHRYEIRIPLQQPISDKIRGPHSALIFYRSSLMKKIHCTARFGRPEPLENVLRYPLDATPSGRFCQCPLEDYQKLYNEGLVVISTFDYDARSNVASFWMSTEDAVGIFDKEKDWQASVWGVRYWERFTVLVSVEGNLKKMGAWIS